MEGEYKAVYVYVIQQTVTLPITLSDHNQSNPTTYKLLVVFYIYIWNGEAHSKCVMQIDHGDMLTHDKIPSKGTYSWSRDLTTFYFHK